MGVLVRCCHLPATYLYHKQLSPHLNLHIRDKHFGGGGEGLGRLKGGEGCWAQTFLFFFFVTEDKIVCRGSEYDFLRTRKWVCGNPVVRLLALTRSVGSAEDPGEGAGERKRGL